MFKSTTKTLQQRVWTLLRSLFLAWIGSAMLFSKLTTTFTRHWSKFQPKIVSLFLTFGIFVFSSLLPHVFACLLNLFSRMKLFSLRVEPFQWHVRLYNHTKLVTSFSSLEGSTKVKLSGLGNIKHLSITALTWITEFRYLRCIISYHIKREQQDSKAKHFCHKMKWKMGQKLLHNRRD